MSLKNTILSVTRRTKNGFTVGEIFDRVYNRLENGTAALPRYSTVRARVYELAQAGSLTNLGVRRDKSSGFIASVFKRNA